jgi:hypothetical protein
MVGPPSGRKTLKYKNAVQKIDFQCGTSFFRSPPSPGSPPGDSFLLQTNDFWAAARGLAENGKNRNFLAGIREKT